MEKTDTFCRFQLVLLIEKKIFTSEVTKYEQIETNRKTYDAFSKK